jgi:hypothetical protein
VHTIEPPILPLRSSCHSGWELSKFPTSCAALMSNLLSVCVIVRGYERALTLFIDRNARQKFLDLHKAIDASPVIPPCQTTDPDLWFSYDETQTKYRVARSFCNRCPVRRECLESALANNEQFGMWGGLTPRERGLLLKQKNSPSRSQGN